MGETHRGRGAGRWSARLFGCAGAMWRTGIDCVGLVLLSLARAGLPVSEPPSYQLRGTGRERAEAVLRRGGLVPAAASRSGDLLLVESGPMQLHLMIRAGAAHVHAHAGLGRGRADARACTLARDGHLAGGLLQNREANNGQLWSHGHRHGAGAAPLAGQSALWPGRRSTRRFSSPVAGRVRA